MDPSQLNSESTYGMGEHAHAILRSFRACWNDGRKVRAEGFADQCPDEERNGLIIALLQVEIEARQQRGEVVELQELDSRFPHLKAEIHRWLTQFIGSKDRANSSTMMGDGVPEGQASELTGFDTGITSGVTQLGRYILKEAIGRGAFGEVWLAEDPKLHRDVAVKVPRLGMALSPQIRQQFVAEGRKAAQLHHPNIVSVYDAGEADGRCYIVSQYVSGGNLRDIIRQGPLDVEKALDIAVKVSEALHYAHEKRIVHRDIKPANILLTDRDQPLITDFGLAKFEAADQSILVPGELAGTPAYMAPEQALQGAHNVDCRADIFSLGIIISEMLTGVRPQVGSSPQEWQAQHQRGLQIIAPSTVRNDVPAEVDHVISRATSRDLATRYTSAQELADDLKIIQRRLSGESIELSTVLAPAIPVVPRRWVLSGGLILGIAVMVGMVSHSVSQVPEPDDGRITVKILTSPEGAEVTFIPLETDTGYPRPDEAVKSQILEEPAGSETRDLADLSSANREITNQQADEIAQQNGTQKVSTARLFPGRYLVVTVWDKDSFHEVYRTVPARDQTSTGGPYSHMFFRKQLDGVVRLPEIVLAQ
ncbi:MAG: serine/threonine protein kinase, partial [Planctomycetaceae bacterium]|nr:serine/threonine protein kinase [Planctomycetaceae bacterium]